MFSVAFVSVSVHPSLTVHQSGAAWQLSCPPLPVSFFVTSCTTRERRERGEIGGREREEREHERGREREREGERKREEREKREEGERERGERGEREKREGEKTECERERRE